MLREFCFSFSSQTARGRIGNYSYKIALSEQSKCNKEKSLRHGTGGTIQIRGNFREFEEVIQESAEQVKASLIEEWEADNKNEDWYRNLHFLGIKKGA